MTFFCFSAEYHLFENEGYSLREEFAPQGDAWGAGGGGGGEGAFSPLREALIGMGDIFVLERRYSKQSVSGYMYLDSSQCIINSSQ